MTRLDMTASEWAHLIKPVLPHAGTDKQEPSLGVIRLEMGPGALYAVATDRYSLGAERWPCQDAGEQQPVHLRATEVKVALGLFPAKDGDDPALRITIGEVAIPISLVGQPRSVRRLAVTIDGPDGTRIVMHDTRDPSADPLAPWRKQLLAALTRQQGSHLDGLNLRADYMTRWTAAAGRGERLALYTGPGPRDPLLILVEHHFAGLWMLPAYLDGPGKQLTETPWQQELTLQLAGQH